MLSGYLEPIETIHREELRRLIMQVNDANSLSSSEWLVFIYPVSIPRQTFYVLVVMEFTLDYNETYNYL
jgi:hypothetical protein